MILLIWVFTYNCSDALFLSFSESISPTTSTFSPDAHGILYTFLTAFLCCKIKSLLN